MGEIADLMLNGTFCEACCTPIGDGQSPGYPRYHRACRPKQAPPVAKPKCPTCGKKVKPTGLADHMRDAHPAQQEAD